MVEVGRIDGGRSAAWVNRQVDAEGVRVKLRVSRSARAMLEEGEEERGVHDLLPLLPDAGETGLGLDEVEGLANGPLVLDADGLPQSLVAHRPSDGDGFRGR